MVGVSEKHGKGVDWNNFQFLKECVQQASEIKPGVRGKSGKPARIQNSFVKNLCIVLGYGHIKSGAPTNRCIITQSGNPEEFAEIKEKVQELFQCNAVSADEEVGKKLRPGYSMETLVSSYKAGHWTENEPLLEVDSSGSGRHPMFQPHAELLERIGLIAPSVFLVFSCV